MTTKDWLDNMDASYKAGYIASLITLWKWGYAVAKDKDDKSMHWDFAPAIGRCLVEKRLSQLDVSATMVDRLQQNPQLLQMEIVRFIWTTMLSMCMEYL